MKRINLELVVGVFVVVGMLSLAYLSVKLGKLDLVGGNKYEVYAEFENAGGIKAGSVVEIAGVEVGRVEDIELDERYEAKVMLSIQRGIDIQDDAIASIKTKGLIGEKYVEISPGGSEKTISDGGRIRDTESAVDIEELISNYVFGKI